ncbi:hypothetical protein HPB49_011658 [Dermacentor silvarum]|uniref:Uncharacterized protein n=1 Tax=Dermacentor silvarum TaxID=543639 RepID=A0ACB8DZB2_DERSI|nr:hypothetical protein HPB49_011658 [Dermacentor silvarum]
MHYCHEGGFTVLGGLVDDWPSYLSRDGVHPSRFGNKVLTEYLYQVACTLSIHLERSHIQQCYKETRVPSSWTSWTRQDKHPCHHRGGVSSMESLSLLLLHPRCYLCGDVASLNHILWGCQEDPPPADLVSPPPTNEQWEALLSSADRDIQTRVLARAEDAMVKYSLAAYMA